MEEKWTKMIPAIIFFDVIVYIGLGIKLQFKFSKFGIIMLILMYLLIILAYIEPRKISIDENGIKTTSFIRKSSYIPMDSIQKIGLENHAYQIAKNYVLYVYTSSNTYTFSTHLFNAKKLNVYLSRLCQEKGIEYYFNK